MGTVKIANAYEIRDMLKAKGGRYDADAKLWEVDAAAWARLVELSKSPGAGMNFKRGMAKARVMTDEKPS
ncbi:MAG TPA: hypothetical protein VNT52_00875 [Acidimicrobiales bacterium]|nr:hypothetical protein [Acidimicrobiales bacterium]